MSCKTNNMEPHHELPTDATSPASARKTANIPGRAPIWFKIGIGIAVLLALAMLALALAGGNHGPGRHSDPPAEACNHAACQRGSA